MPRGNTLVGVALLVAVLVVGSVTAASIVDSVTGDPSVETPHDDLVGEAGQDVVPAAVSTDDGAVPPSLEGDVTTAPVVHDERVFVGTDRGLYVVTDGSIDLFVEAQPVQGIELVDDDLVVLLVQDDHFPNVKGIDVETGEVAWTESHEREVYSPDLEHVNRQVPAFDAAAIGDDSGTVAVAAGNTVFALDGATGERLWETEGSHNVWRLAADEKSVYAGTQDGYLRALDATDGDHQYEIRLADPFESEDVGPIPRSVWDVKPVTINGADRLAVATEDGTVAVVDPADGTVVEEVTVHEFNDDALEEYYTRGDLDGTPTVPGDANFFNLELTVVEDDSGTLAASVDIDDRPALRGYPAATTELHLVDASTGTVEWSNENPEVDRIDTVAHSPAVADGSLLVAQPPAGEILPVETFDVDDGTSGEPIEIRTIPGIQNHGPGFDEAYVVADGSDLIVATTTGDLLAVDASGAIQWELPALADVDVTSGDFLGDGTDDFLLTSENELHHWEVQTRSISVRSGEDGSIAWSTIRDTEGFYEDGGYDHVQTIESVDESADVLAVQQPLRRDGDPRDLEPGSIVLFAGEDGAELARYELSIIGDHPVRPTSVAPIGDVSGSGTPDVFVGHNHGAFVLDVYAEDVIWEQRYDDHGSPPDGLVEHCENLEEELDDETLSDEERAHLQEEYEEENCEEVLEHAADVDVWNPLDGQPEFRAIGGDGDIKTLLAVSREGETAVLEPALTGGDLSFETVTETTHDWELATDDPIRPLGDMTGDGYQEVALAVREDDDGVTKLFAPGRGETIATLHRHGLDLASVEGYFGGDGERGTIAFEERGDESTLSVYDGTERVSVDEPGRAGALRPLASGGIATPAAPAGDVTGDGTDELAIVESASSGGTGARIHLQAVTADERVDTIELESWEEPHGDPFVGVHAERIPDQTGDGQPELGVVAVTDGSAESGVHFFVVDPHEGDVLVRGDGPVSSFVDLDAGVGVIRPDGSMRVVDVTAGVTLAEPDGQSPLHLAWTFDDDEEYVTVVSVADTQVAMTTEQSTEVRLPAGTHEITVQSTTADGITVYDSSTVTVEADTNADVFLYGASVVAVAGLFAVGLAPRLRRRFGG